MRDGSPGPRGSIRAELSGFVGRRAELGRIRAALAGARLVTLTGPGGIGKTRLAVQAAAEVHRRHQRSQLEFVLPGGPVPSRTASTGPP